MQIAAETALFIYMLLSHNVYYVKTQARRQRDNKMLFIFEKSFLFKEL